MILLDSIRIYCETHGIKARKLGKLAHIHPATAQKFLDGNNKPSGKTITALLQWLLNEEDYDS